MDIGGLEDRAAGGREPAETAGHIELADRTSIGTAPTDHIKCTEIGFDFFQIEIGGK